MGTEVLLMAEVAELGSEGDVVTVSDGYARNCLFPQKLGAPVTEATRRRLAAIQRKREEGLQAELAAAGVMAEKLGSASCTITVKTGEDDKLYGSVTTGDITEALKNQGIEIDRHAVELDDPIRELGVFDVKVKVHPQVDATVKVWIVEE